MNTTHPFSPDYTGPTQGWFTFLHHGVPVEYSDNVIARRDYVLANKPVHEQRVRALACQVIPAALTAALDTAWTALTTPRTAYYTAETALDTAWTALTTPRTAYHTAETALDTAETAYTTAIAAYTTARATLDTAWTAYHTAETALDTAWLCEHLPATPWRTLYDETHRTLIYEAHLPWESQP